MKDVGGGNMQIAGMYIILMLGFGLGALLIAVPLGNITAQSIGGGMAQWLNFYVSPYHGYQSTLIQQAIVALVVPLLAALLPVYNSVRITVREAISDYGIGSGAKRKNDSVSEKSVLMPRPMR